MRVSYSGIKETIKHLEDIRKKLGEDKIHSALQRLAEKGYQIASAGFNSAMFDGTNDVQVNIVWESENVVTLVASGQSVLFIEFGTGATYGYGHPLAQQYGYGPGTWSDNEALGGKGHWNDPNGWYYKHNTKSLGNPPARAMYDAFTTMRDQVEEILREMME